ncbi:MAG: hypothetical protein KC912_09020 [Proteobacteria bacterium]|nr:hypothetical protein [Pseudomonadota bacterium]
MKTLTALMFWFLSQFGGPVPVDAESCDTARLQRSAIEETLDDTDCVEPAKTVEFGFAPASISNGF